MFLKISLTNFSANNIWFLKIIILTLIHKRQRVLRNWLQINTYVHNLDKNVWTIASSSSTTRCPCSKFKIITSSPFNPLHNCVWFSATLKLHSMQTPPVFYVHKTASTPNLHEPNTLRSFLSLLWLIYNSIYMHCTYDIKFPLVY